MPGSAMYAGRCRTALLSLRSDLNEPSEESAPMGEAQAGEKPVRGIRRSRTASSSEGSARYNGSIRISVARLPITFAQVATERIVPGY